MTREDNQPVKKTPDQPSTEKQQTLSFFQAAHRVFLQAGQSAGDPIDCFYQVGVYTIRLRFAGPAIIPYVTPALEHLATRPSRSPSLTICIWDNISTNTTLPPLPGELIDYVTRRGIRRYDDGRFFAAVFPGINILNILDTKRNLALYCLRDPSQFPSYQLGSPLLTLLHWGMRNYGLQLIHAAAVGTSSLGAVLIVGKGGVGKSTIALTCLNSELAYISDDYCLLGLHPAPYAYNLYNTGKLDRDHIQRFPHMVRINNSLDYVDDGKKIFFIHSLFPKKIVKSVPIRAILVPFITGQPETKVTHTSASEALKALALSTMYQLSGKEHEALKPMIKLVNQVPCYEMELGTDLTAIPGVIISLLSHIS